MPDGTPRAPDDHVAHVTEVLRPLGAAKRLTSGQTLYRQGDRGSTVYLIERGEVKLSIEAGDAQLAISTAGLGSLLGTGDALDGFGRDATATALSACVLIAVPGQAFDDLLDHDPNVRHQVMGILAADVRSAHRRLSAQYSQTTLGRVAARLLMLTAATCDGEQRIVHTTQCALAEWIGATRESTSRSLADLRRKGCITTGRGWIRVVDRDALVELEAI
jgi:CRP-like cAMP-binding protein